MSYDLAAARQRLKNLTWSVRLSPHNDATEALIRLAAVTITEVGRLTDALAEQADVVRAQRKAIEELGRQFAIAVDQLNTAPASEVATRA